MAHKIVISRRDSPDIAIDEISDIASNIRWDFNRIGGCGSFSFDVPIKLFKDPLLGLDFNVKIYVTDSTGAFDLRYQGKIQNKVYNVRGIIETITVQGFGYQTELNNIDVDRDYTSTETSLIVEDILSKDVVPNTNITFEYADVEVTTFTPDSLEFNTSAISAIRTLAETVGTREWGVDVNRQLYFKERSSAVSFRFPLGTKISDITYDISSKDIVNRIKIVGGDVSGSPFTRVADDLVSQFKWKRRDGRIQNSAIITDAVADQFAAARFAEFSNVVRRVKFTTLDSTFFETALPVGLFQLRSEVDTYGTKKYGTGLYNSLINLQVNRISYRINNEGTITSSISLGVLRPDIAETIKQVESKIEQLQSVGV